MKELRVAERGRAYKRVNQEPVVTITARKYSAETGEWEPVQIENIIVEKING